jgi:hypothetical protein
MPTATTFTSLQSDVVAYLERGAAVDTTVYDQIPRLINLAERSIAKALKIQGFINTVTADFASGTSVYQKPDRWRQTISINFATTNYRLPLFARSYEYCRSFWPDSSLTGTPQFYADYNYDYWLIAPTPDAVYHFEVMYYEQPPFLDTTNQTNWLTDYLPQALLYRTLLEASPFLKDDSRMGVWQNLYQEAVASANTEDIKKMVDRSSTRQGA